MYFNFKKTYLYNGVNNILILLVFLSCYLISSSTLALQDNLFSKKKQNIAFLIEGEEQVSSGNGNNLIEGVEGVSFPDIESAISLAKKMGCPIFDSVSSYDTDHLLEALKDADEREQKLIVIYTYVQFLGVGGWVSPKRIVNTIVKPAFERLITERLITEIPGWLNFLMTIEDRELVVVQLATIIDAIFPGGAEVNKGELYDNESERIDAKMDRISDKLSEQRLIAYLINNPIIDTVYGLIGSRHLNMLDATGKIISSKGNYKQLQITFPNGKTVNVHLWGGTHMDITHYNEMVKFIKKQGKQKVKMEL